MDADILHAAEFNDFEEAEEALEENPFCIKKKNRFSQNALQVAILNLHSEFAIYLLENTSISAYSPDFQGDDALKMAIKFGEEALVKKVYERWNQEYLTDLSGEKTTEIYPAPK